MYLDWWALPGPSAFINGLQDDLRAGRNIVLRLPRHAPQGLREAVHARVSENELWRWSPLCMSAEQGLTGDPVSFLSRRFAGLPSGRVHDERSLAVSGDLRDHVIWIEGLAGEQWPAWRDFITRYSDHCRESEVTERGLVIVCCDGELAEQPPAEDVALAVHTCRGTIESLDMSLWLAQALSNDPFSALELRLRIAVAAELAGTDPGLACELARAKLETLFDPQAHLLPLAQERGWQLGNGGVPVWHEGMVDELEGLEHRHVALLAVSGEGGMAELRRRVWQGQLGVLFPLLERHRVSLIEHLEPVLRTPFMTEFGKVTDAWSLELSHIYAQVKNRNIGRELRGRIATLIRMRNALAHLEPVQAEDVRQLILWGGLLAAR